MAVDITLVIPKRSYSGGTRSFTFTDDGYYWFLYPIFEKLHSRTSQMIDLYGDAEFGPDHLLELKQAISDARALVLEQPETWLVHIGTQARPTYEKLYFEVGRTTFLGLIEQIENMIEYAIEENGTIVCLGD